MVNAQEWLDNKYPNNKEDRKKETELYIGEKNLEGHLDLRDFINLKNFNCYYNQLTSLDLTGLEELESVQCNNNYLETLDFSALNPDKLTCLNITGNNLHADIPQDISCFSKFTNLETLWIGSDDEEIRSESYNGFIGSLESLKGLTKLSSLHISNTDVNGSIEYLPNSIEEIYCSFAERPESKVKSLEEQLKANSFFDFEDGKYVKNWENICLILNNDIHSDFTSELQKEWEEEGFDYEQTKKWANALGEKFKVDDYDFCAWLRDEKKLIPRKTLGQDLDELREEYDESGWETCEESEETVNAQEWLNQNYPKKRRKEVTKLNINGKNLEGLLVLEDFYNLKEFDCSHNQLTNINLSNCSQLERINCSDNLLTNIALPTNPANLKRLDLTNNNFPSTQDLSFLTPYSSLEKLKLGNKDLSEEKTNQGIYSHFTGSLDYLSGMEELRYLNISNTNINEVQIDKLPRSLRYIDYSTDKRPDCKLTEIVPLLDKYFGVFGCCLKCRLAKTSVNWCHPCREKEWQEDIKNLTGQELIEKFIQQQPNEIQKIQWISYEQFTNIEKIAEGGFSKIYKAIWKGGDYGDRNEAVALKSLNNSQNITLEFLSEIANTKLVGGDEYPGSSRLCKIVKCYGISQDPKTKNYVIVMEYMKGGNLREYLKNEYSEMDLLKKLIKLLDIINGLKDIHDQNLVHRDFHSGNILNDLNDLYEDCITDLGLSCPANHQKEEGKIFGVLPYIAPEVLQGQPYIQASDIYSFGIIAYELLANSYPCPEMNDLELSLKICQGYRPNIDEIPLPQEMKDLIKRCWDANPKKRPSTGELKEIIYGWYEEIVIKNKEKTEFCHQFQVIWEEYSLFSQYTPYQIHPNITTHSRAINTKEIAQLFQESEKQALELELEKIEKEINQSLAEEQKKLVSDFIQTHKRKLKDRKDKEARSKFKELKEKLKEQGLADENIEKIIKYCERFIETEEQLQANMEMPTNN